MLDLRLCLEIVDKDGRYMGLKDDLRIAGWMCCGDKRWLDWIRFRHDDKMMADECAASKCRNVLMPECLNAGMPGIS